MANPEHSDYCNCTCPQGLSYDKLEKTLNRVRMVHIKETRDGVSYCTGCVDHDGRGDTWQLWPCETIAALVGDDNDA